MNKIYYLGYYSDLYENSQRKSAPAADMKMDYIISVLKQIGYEVKILSFCVDDDRSCIFKRKPGYEIDRNGCIVHFFTNYASKYRILRVLGRMYAWLKIKKYLCENCIGNDCKIIIYHSLGLLNVIKLLHQHKQKFILEMEEIYADVIGKDGVRKEEIISARKASGFIFPTKMLDEHVCGEQKPYVIVHGTYKVEPDRQCKILDKYNNSNGKRIIHCVYAGTFDPRKGGAAAAAAVAEFLPENYHIHIIGFGSDEETRNIIKIISRVADKSKAKVSYDGLLIGEDYIRFIQSCDIGLSTQNPNAAFNDTSFPSKILSYLANGLRVVSIRIPVIEQSGIGDKLFYYNEQTPEQIANAILSVDINDSYDSRQIISQLSEQFEKELSDFLKRCQ